MASQVLWEGEASRRVSVSARLADLHGAFVGFVAGGDAELARECWVDYLSETANLWGQGAGAAGFDVVSVWRAQRADDGGGISGDKMAAMIAREIRIRIADGALRDGDQLPPMPELAAEFAVSRPTMREGLRILEMEGLVDLRTGSRSGARILEPTTETAAQLAGTLLEFAQTRMADVAEARALIEPSVMELVATRIDKPTLAALSHNLQELKNEADNTHVFIQLYHRLLRDAFSAARNPAISVAADVTYWVFLRGRRALTVSALSVPEVIRSNRRACVAFEAFLAAADRDDPTAAGLAWTKHLQDRSPFYRSPLGDRLLVDMLD